MKFLECDLEEIIMKTKNKTLKEKGLFIDGYKKNQVRIGNYGIADIITFSKYQKNDFFKNPCKVITVYELKKDKISLSSFAQGVNYIKGIQDYFNFIGRDVHEYYWSLVLVGRYKDESSSLIYLPDLLSENEMGKMSLNIYEYDYTINGLYFEEIFNYSLVNKGF